jgi:probable F420-dependent oxidoreductase
VTPPVGRLGVWRRHFDGTEPVAAIEALGYTTLWLGASPSLEQARPYLDASKTLTIATGILNVWQHDPADVAAQRAELARDFPGRFLLGIGVGHPEATAEYTTPLARMRAFFDGLDAAPEPVPRDERMAAALGPRMLELAAQRAAGTHTYFVTPEHTRFAREQVGPDALVAPEVAVVVEPDDETARAAAREYAGRGHRRGRPGPFRGGRRPCRAPAAGPRVRADGGLRGARRGAALTAAPDTLGSWRLSPTPSIARASAS